MPEVSAQGLRGRPEQEDVMPKWSVSWICDRAGQLGHSRLRAEEMHAECGGVGFVANSGRRWACSCWCHKTEEL
jgi:hypothetical protein